MQRPLIALLSCAALLAACAAQPDANSSKAAGPMEKYWKLVEINGQSVPTLKREPHFILKTEGQRVSGFGGCNNFGGSHEIDAARSRIRFHDIASTKMACEDGMAVENAFHQALSQADGYLQNGDQLTLTQGGTPLARLNAVYMR